MKHILIIGPQGSGKTTKAISLAKEIGSYIHCEIDTINTELRGILNREPAAVIVEGSPCELRLKNIISRNEAPIRLKRKDGVVETFKRPKFIFCCDESTLGHMPHTMKLDIIVMRGKK